MPCICCQEKVDRIDYKETDILRKFVTGQFKVMSSKRTGLCQKHQRKAANAVKIARYMGLMPYTRNQVQKGRRGRSQS